MTFSAFRSPCHVDDDDNNNNNVYDQHWNRNKCNFVYCLSVYECGTIWHAEAKHGLKVSRKSAEETVWN
jgi:hypothetical protein